MLISWYQGGHHQKIPRRSSSKDTKGVIIRRYQGGHHQKISRGSSSENTKELIIRRYQGGHHQKIPRESSSEAVNGWTDNKMVKEKRTMLHKILQRKLKIEQHTLL
jgi:hypothetical protein